MTCNNSIHDLNCPDSYNNNALKSASASAAINQQQKQYSRQNTKNQNQQSTKLKGASSLVVEDNNNNPFKSLDNIRKMVGLTTTSNESATAVSHLKGASDSTPQNNNIFCSKKEHLKDLLKQFNLI